VGQTLGVKDYLVKPISRQALLKLLERLGTDIRRILVVDDDPRMGKLLQRLLEANLEVYEVIWAKNGQEGLRKMREQLPDLVLMDLSMPEMDGYTLLAEMRQDSRLCHIPVAVITAHLSTPDEERQLGGKSLFVSNLTGFTNEEILNYLRHLLEAAGVPLSSRRARYTLQRGQQVGLGHRLS
jgi:CheY-like chemotaxis protein